jgi:hypothetical protein
MSECMVKGCANKKRANGLCDKHRKRLDRYGLEGLADKATECSIDECESKPRARGMCDSHYRRWLRSGSAEGVGQGRGPRPNRKKAA